MHARVLSTALLAGAALALAGCQQPPSEEAIAAEPLECPSGSDCYDEVEAVGPGGMLTVEAGEFYFEFKQGAAVQGDVTFELDNTGSSEHNIEVLGAVGAEGAVVEAAGGESGEGTVDLFPGEYTIICNIPGHRSSGMEETITVFADEDEAAAGVESEAPGAASTEGIGEGGDGAGGGEEDDG